MLKVGLGATAFNVFLVREVVQIVPDAGESYVIGACRQRVRDVTQRIRDVIAVVDPVIRAFRRSVSITRRTYNIAAPNSLW